jgi:hypothetical protein
VCVYSSLKLSPYQGNRSSCLRTSLACVVQGVFQKKAAEWHEVGEWKRVRGRAEADCLQLTCARSLTLLFSFFKIIFFFYVFNCTCARSLTLLFCAPP